MHARYESSVRDYYEVKDEGWISSLLKYCFINAYGLAWVLGWSWGYEKCEFAIVGSLSRAQTDFGRASILVYPPKLYILLVSDQW